MSLINASFVYLLFTTSLILVNCNFDDNEILGQPVITCESDTIDMQFRTRRPFTGKVFVRGNYNRPECRVDYGRRTVDGRPLGGIRLNHGACNMDRQRMITPEGMMFSTVLIISFHPLFVTKMDKAYHIKCMYKEAVRTVKATLDVSSLPTESIAADVPMPTCTYTIRKDSLDGPILQIARVGDQIVHRWQCDSDEYGVLVHNCFVEDGHGQKHLIIDDNGCHTDRLLLGDPTYVEALNMAYRESFVFKFADRIDVRFQCEIRLCLKEDGGCDDITPPLCVDSNRLFPEKPPELNVNNTVSRRLRRATKIGDFISQTVYVMDKDDSEDQKKAVLPLESSPAVCMAQRSLIFLATCLAMSLIISATLGLYVLHKRLQSPFHKTRSNYY
ncbi:unnamed protein product [Auanema sp. JU1783]|nr:unnamed protein product [Auanema sp. JU1783]